MTQQKVQGDWGIIRCIWENWVIKNTALFEKLIDESEDKSKPYFSRVYGMKISGVLTTYRIAFIYDRKTKIATVSCDNIISQAMSCEARKEEIDEQKLLSSIAKEKIR